MANWLTNIFDTKKWLRRDEDGVVSVFSRMFSASPQFNDYDNERKKIDAVLSNPAMLKVICLQCDLFSLGKIYCYKGDIEQENDPFIKLLERPNPFQSRSQFLWDLMFWTMIGNAYLYVDSDVPTEDNKMYFLDPSRMEWPTDMDRKKDKIILSKKSEKELFDTTIKYKFEDNSTMDIPLSKITHVSDLSNGLGNWFISPSRIDALYKIISNTEETLDSLNVNIKHTRKFIIAGQADPKNTTQLPLSTTEATDIETKINGRKNVHALKSMIDVKRIVEDMRSLDLNKIYLDHFFLIGSMYNIPRDVLEAYASSTFDNQEKARAGHVSYTLEPKGEAMFELLGRRFGYHLKDLNLTVSWDHLPFVQVFEYDRAKTKNMQVMTMEKMLKMNIDIKEINEYLDTNFSSAKYEQPKVNAGANQGNQG